MIMNINQISERIKQRPPFQMIERVLELVPGESARGTKNVSVNEPYFMGHFPGMPIMPGVLIIECCAQLSSLVVDYDGTKEDFIYVLLKVDGFKFVKPVIPGDTLQIAVNCVLASAAAYEFEAKISVDGVVKAKGNMLFTTMDKSAVYGE